MKFNIFLIGFSGTGKSTVSRILSKRLGYEFIDTDLQIEQLTGRSVQEIFAQDGEAAFRRIESKVLADVCKEDLQVVSTGGGIVMNRDNRLLMTAHGYVICLEARPETLYVRLLLDSSQQAERPLLKSGDPFERIQTLKAERAPYYADADWTVHTDFLSPEEIANEIERGLDFMERRSEGAKGGAGSPATPGSPHAARPPVPEPPANPNAIWVKTPTASYPVIFGVDLLDQLGQLIRENLPDAKGQRIFLISDSAVGSLYAERVRQTLERDGWKTMVKLIPAGESSKNLEQVSQLYDWLAENKAERKDVVVALGGGVVGDLTGFAAATWLRGVSLVQVPTTILAMVDSSIGGKTGVNHPRGKNLIGSFYQPRLVVSDVRVATTLPDRIRREGWAEVIKHAVIPGADPNQFGAIRRFDFLENYYERLLKNDLELLPDALRESAAVKVAVVSQDERENGLRLTLNYGHTYGHALEAAGNYQVLQHGEAVAIGMHGEALLAQRMGLIPSDSIFVRQQKQLLQRFGLPLSTKVDKEKTLAALKLDKKVAGGNVRWVLPIDIGRVTINQDVPASLVHEVLNEIVED